MDHNPNQMPMDLRQRRAEADLEEAYRRFREDGEPLPIDLLAKLQAAGMITCGYW